MCKTCGWVDADKAIDDIIDKLDDLPDEATEFREGVEEKLRGMAAWIETHKHVTEKMDEAVENIGAAVSRWLRE